MIVKEAAYTILTPYRLKVEARPNTDIESKSFIHVLGKREYNVKSHLVMLDVYSEPPYKGHAGTMKSVLYERFHFSCYLGLHVGL